MSRTRWLGGSALLLYGCYAGAFIWQTSFVIDGQRIFCLFDDAMISMAYARNLVEGYGLNWARWGAPVEGFTHPLWTFSLVLPQLTGLDLGSRPLLVQLGSLVILLLNVVAIYRLALRHFCISNPLLALLPAIATAAYFPLNYWSLVGMESGLQALLVVTGIRMALDAADDDKGGRIIALFALAAVSILLRMDMALFAFWVIAYAFLTTRRQWRRAEWLRGVLLLCLILGMYQAFRVYYFGDWLPNTYYLKMTGGNASIRIARGALVFLDFLEPVLLSVGTATLAGILTLRKRPKQALLLCVIYTYFAYSIYVGGDAWEWSHMTGNRFQCFVFPLVIVLLAGALDEILSNRGVRIPVGVVLGLALLVSADTNGLLFGPNRDLRLEYVLLQGRPYHTDSNEGVTRDTFWLNKHLSPDARVAVVWAGIPAYFSNFQMVDVMGYNDREIAKGFWSPSISLGSARDYYPGHMKFDLEKTLRDAQPDVLFQWWTAWGWHEVAALEDAGYYRRQVGPSWLREDGVIWLRESAGVSLH